MGEITPMAKRLRGYFKDYFGPLSHTFDINNHTFVALDAPGLVDEEYQRAGRGVSFDKWTPIPNGPIAFVNEVAAKARKWSSNQIRSIASKLPRRARRQQQPDHPAEPYTSGQT